jgi:spore germination protein GerM
MTTNAAAPDSQKRYQVWQVMFVAALFGVGLWLRHAASANIPFASGGWHLPGKSAAITLYFADGQFLFPVSRQMPRNDSLPRVALQALLDGPGVTSRLKSFLPSDVQIRSLDVSNGVAQIDLSVAFLNSNDPTAAKTAVVDTMTALPDVKSVRLSVEGNPVLLSSRRVPLSYYPSANGLIAVPVSATDPRAALVAYLSRPVDSEITAFPADARLLSYNYTPTDGLLSLGFAYTPSIRELALDKPDRMRTLLLGLITSLTEFPEVRAVRLDFEGQARLGLGQCSDLLRTPQPRPNLLNDERLLEE